MKQEHIPNMNWEAFVDYFRRTFPPSDYGAASHWLEKEVKDSIESAMAGMRLMDSESIDLFETHRSVIAKIIVPNRRILKSLSIRVNEEHMKVSGFRHKEIQTIRFPTFVIPSTAKAVYKNGVLQVQIRKKEKSERYYELNIEY